MRSKFIHLVVALITFTLGASLALIWLHDNSPSEVKDGKPQQQLSKESGVAAVKAGTSFGMCFKDCNEDVTIKNTELQVVVSSGYDARFTDKKLKNKRLKDKVTEQEWKSILQLIDSKVLMALPDVFGCPDCADGGAAWVEVTFNDGTSKRVTYEYRYPPQQIKALADKLTAIREPYLKRLR